MPEEKDKLVCRCLLVTEEAVRGAIRSAGLRTVEEVMEATRAGTGCSSCYEDLQGLLDEAAGRPRTERPAAPRSSHAERRGRILEVLREPCGPLLRANGIQVHVVDIDGNRALVRVLMANGRTTHDESTLAVKRFVVGALEHGCGERISLIELNVIERAQGRPGSPA